MNHTVNLSDEDLQHFAMFNAGRVWAQSLKPGDTFRGSYGEAAWRGLSDWDAKFFSAGGQVELTNKQITLTNHDSNIIHAIA